MSTVTIKVPSSLKMNAFDVSMLVATKLFEDGKISSGQAAEIVGISKRAFVELLGKYGVSIFGYDFNELEKDIENA
ncbi:MAG TPA: UPF0175 family protein [Bacteroidetes bacterium]|nr:UPF0175 family protein [Bacteroidota bacterium]